MTFTDKKHRHYCDSDGNVPDLATLKEMRCEKCNKMLYRLITPWVSVTDDEKTALVVSDDKQTETRTIECKCPRCGEINKSDFS